MLLLQVLFLALLALGGAASAQSPGEGDASARGFYGQQFLSAEAARQDTPPASCHVTIPTEYSSASIPQLTGKATRFGIAAYGLVSNYGTDKLSTLLPVDGVWRGLNPRKVSDFAYSNKLPWFRIHPAFSVDDDPLTVTGKRLDGPAPRFVSTFASNGMREDKDRAMLMGGIDIPVYGCWEINGHYKDADLSFTVWVTPHYDKESPPSEQVGEPESSKPAARVHVDGEVEARRLVYQVIPETPHEARVANISGTVVLSAIIGEDGRARDLHYISGPKLLAQAAINAVSWWDYWVTGDREEIETTVAVTFPPITD
jgi:hypothetical protein